MSKYPESPALPSKMRAWVRTARGQPSDVLSLSRISTPTLPSPSSSEVLIRVSHVALQSNSTLMLRLLPGLPFAGPWVPEIECAGHVVAAGAGAPAEVRETGTAVAAFRTVPAAVLVGNGVLAEYILVEGANVVRVSNEDISSAAGLNGSGSTALKMIRTAKTHGMKENDKVLVNGASGSVGSVLTQLLKTKGVKVCGVSSGVNEAYVRGFGVDEFIDYRKCDSLGAHLADQYGDSPFDFIFDCVGTQDLFTHSPHYLRPTGVVINIGNIDGMLSMTYNWVFNTWQPVWLGGVPRRYITFSTPPTREAALEIADLMERGRLRIPVDSVFKCEDLVSAYARVDTKRAKGRVVVNMTAE